MIFLWEGKRGKQRREPSTARTHARTHATGPAALTPSPGASPPAPCTCPAAPRSPSAWPPPAWPHACVGPGPPTPPPTSPAALGGCPVLGTPPNMGGAGWPEAGGRCWEQQGPAQVSTHLRHRPSLVPSPSEEAGGVPPGQRRPSCHWFCDTRGTETGCPAANRPVRARRVEPVTLPAPAPRSPPRPGPFGCTVAHRRSAQQAAVGPRA